MNKKIEEVLHLNAQLFQNLGTDSTKKEIEAAKIQERKNLRKVREYDPEMIEMLLKASDK
jgi:hypothetical protein